MSPDSRPETVPFDPGSDELPPSLGPVLTESDTPILLLVAAEANDDAARLAIGLAEARAAGGQRTVLGDADLDTPRLHRLLDVSNLEGLVDVFLFGASLPRVSVRPQMRAFEFVPAGAYAPHPEEVLGSPRWDRLSEDLTGEDAVLLVFVPATAPGLRALSGRIGSAIILGDDRTAAAAADTLDPACRVLAVVERAGRVAPERLSAQAQPPAPGTATIFDGPELTEPLVIRERKRERSVSPVLVVALTAALALGAMFAYQEYVRGNVDDVIPVVPIAAGEPAAPPERGALLETPLPYSVAVEAHQDLEAAMERARSLEAAEPDLGFQVAPLSVNGVLYYRLVAGPVEDRDAGLDVLRRLVAAEHKSGLDTWAVLPTAYAFLLGHYPTEAEARARVDALADAGIPSYVVPQRYETGQVEYRVYGGAYVNRAEADVMRQLLENAGEEAPLVERTGEPEA